MNSLISKTYLKYISQIVEESNDNFLQFKIPVKIIDFKTLKNIIKEIMDYYAFKSIQYDCQIVITNRCEKYWKKTSDFTTEDKLWLSSNSSLIDTKGNLTSYRN